jgi:hypothetical protein
MMTFGDLAAVVGALGNAGRLSAAARRATVAVLHRPAWWLLAGMAG